MAGPAFAQPPVQSCGAAPGMTSEINLLDAAELAQQPQTRNAKSGASGSAPTMAELNMVLETLQTLVPEFPKLEPGDPIHSCPTTSAVAPSGVAVAGASRTPR